MVWAGKPSNQHNFGCMTASDLLFYSIGGFWGQAINEDIAKIEGRRDVAMAANVETKITINGFM